MAGSNKLQFGYLHYNLGLLAHQLGRKKEARHEYERALELFQQQRKRNEDMAAKIPIPAFANPLDEQTAFRAAEAIASGLLQAAPPELGNAEVIVRDCLRLQIAGCLATVGNRTRVEVATASEFTVAATDYLVEGWNALATHRYRVAVALLRPTLESCLYAMAPFLFEDFVDSWIREALRPGTVHKIVNQLKKKVGAAWPDSLEHRWRHFNTLAHCNVNTIRGSAAPVTVLESGEKGQAVSIGGAVYLDESARSLAVLYSDLSRQALIVQSLCVVAPRERFPRWYEKFEILVPQMKQPILRQSEAPINALDRSAG